MDGSSSASSFCAMSMIRLSAFMARSRARIDFSRPTNRGMTTWGNTTTSRNGRTGSTSRSPGKEPSSATFVTCLAPGAGRLPGVYSDATCFTSPS